MQARLVRMVILAVIALAAPTSVAGDDGLSATLDGRTVPIERIGRYDCHDFDYPVIRCFTSARQAGVDIEARLADEDASASRVLAIGYVTVWEHVSFGGASMTLSSSQPWLSAIGWNDRISSFRSFGATGGFWEHSPSGGFWYPYGSSAYVTSLGSFNDQFSAFVIN
jgi:hypothetical protein